MSPGSHSTMQKCRSAARIVASVLMSVSLASPLMADPAPLAGHFRIGVLYWSMNIPGQVAMRQGLEAEVTALNRQAAKRGKKQIVIESRVAGDGEDGIANQIKQMMELIALNVDMIVVQPTDNAALAEPLRAANRAHIPVVAYDQYISGGTLAAYRTSDNYQAGYLDGEYISSRFPKNKELCLIIVEYPHVSSTVERLNGFLEALSSMKRKYKIIKTYIAVEPRGGKKAALEILREFPQRGSIDVLFTVNDGAGLSIVQELSTAGRSEIMMATIDGDPASVANIKAGRLTVVDAAQFCGPLGAEAIRTAYSILTGIKTPYHALVPTFPITKETMHLYPGWMGPIPRRFAKQWKSDSPIWNGSMRTVK